MQSKTQSSVFENYLSLARKYCDSCESALIGDQRQFLSHIQGLLLEIYSQGRLMPETSTSGQDFDSMFERDDKAVQDMIAEKVSFSYYWQTLEPFSVDESPLGLGDLLDDLGDIYIDLKRASLLYDSNLNGAKQQAYWKFKFDFDHHLADHTMNAMKAIHDYMGKDGYNGW
jgi:hypothetical protein